MKALILILASSFLPTPARAAPAPPIRPPAPPPIRPAVSAPPLTAPRIGCKRPRTLFLRRFEDASAWLECDGRVLVRISVPG